VGWNGFQDAKRIGLPQAATLGDAPQIALGAIALCPADRKVRRPFEDELRVRLVNREPKRAEGMLAAAARIKKPKMEASSCINGRLPRLSRSLICISLLSGKALH
jgi:hypothetical protein